LRAGWAFIVPNPLIANFFLYRLWIGPLVGIGSVCRTCTKGIPGFVLFQDPNILGRISKMSPPGIKRAACVSGPSVQESSLYR